ncbi:hypothetical protein DL766_004324 [Monosporascus sp. MC13-8B]|uniref:lytic cellulose monooxygenase (C4-dehydrogenating) n=1 Tax=Monosporascus cannonballus TaxID=155416 RepID=A0ABY0H1G9_9PEZI|nr:hypothetical protein DL762_006804 [Monosporascus cannonballus]RYO98451.1 hypothetical protein DL763_002187 [Monosporascus cannonballus]RYP31548.1 hypothetical protein DL766_004324 [Monosporascus sp. MC13-8B]
MKSFAGLLAAALAVAPASAHYIFQQLKVGNTQFSTWEHIRQHTNGNSPVTDLASNDLRCNLGAKPTTTVAVKAGDSFTWTLDTAVYHQGPISLYMSKAPGNAAAYDGSGDWFKIKDFGPEFQGNSASWPLYQTYTSQIPRCIENGEYLLRIQSLAIHNPWPAGIPQFYISCAQVSVTGGTGTAKPKTAKIPGAFKATDPGYTANIYNNFNSYTVPGPEPPWKSVDSEQSD